MKKRLCLKDTQGKFYLPLTDIIRFEADGCYTIVHTAGGKKYTQSGSLGKYYERVEHEELFLRIYRSHVINILYVFRIDNCGSVIMLDGIALPITEEARNIIEGMIPSC